jgi:hypothetical protein
MIHDSSNVNSTTMPPSVSNQTTSSTTPPSVSDQTTSSTTPPSVSDQTTSSTTSPSVSNQTTSSTTPPSVSNQTTSSTTPLSVSDQAVNHFKQTSAMSSVQRVERREIQKYHQQIVSADEQPGYLHATDDDAGYHRIIDDSSNGHEPDKAESCNNTKALQQGYYSLIENDTTYQEISANEASNQKVDDQGVYNKLNQARTTSISKTFCITAAGVDGLQ